MKIILLLLAVFCATNSIAQEDVPIAVPEIAVKIRLGETVQIGDVAVKFAEVLEDSRCPENVTCIWAGRIRVKVEVQKLLHDPVFEELLIGQTRSGEKRNTILYSVESYQIKGLAVTPYPNTENIGNRDYALLVKEFKLQ